ncbi:hemerythrin domain-containing protein [Aquabacterium sp. A7-Y]|uniref:hemerythrin domain-containing protein n=1 Tax=Aquabacterium sp. A7-Y TaxID=1349605 RepID=UPI00223CA40C|nr:hemerythrin domain-containing protein [Aquabacterium sp. A7-Y]MCW7537876.1 hemerythrin domain-containing protein [Aquabacterium sp. A7-Y]
MAALISQLSPSVTDMIRMDHSHVLETFHQFHAGNPPDKKAALVNATCLALEIHAQLEEEVFYPALRELASDVDIVEKSYPEHAEMRRLMAELRGMRPGDPGYDSTYLELMRNVLHHVADEETTLIPAAERLLSDRLQELGAQMTRRRLQLLGSRAPEVGWTAMRSFPEGAVLMAAGAVGAGAYLLNSATSALPRFWR